MPTQKVDICDMLQMLKYIFKSVPFAFSKGLILWFFAPLFVTLILFILGFSFTNSITENIWVWLLEVFNLETDEEDELGFVAYSIFWVLLILIKLAYFFVIGYVFSTILMLLLSPVFSFLSYRVLKIELCDLPPQSISLFVSMTLKAIFIGLLHLFVSLLVSFIAFVFSMVPIIQFFIPFLLLVIQSSLMGYLFIDYSLEHLNLNVEQRIQFYKKHFASMVILGLPFLLLCFVPFIGFFMAVQYAMIGVMAASMYLAATKASENSPKSILHK